MGSAACRQLARSGLRVLGLEQFSIPHARGSSHGVTRILRLGLHEGPLYVPMVRRALELWQELGDAHGEALFTRTGSLDVGQPDSTVFAGSRRACEKWSVEHEILEAGELRRRFPAFHPDSDMVAVYQPGSGYVAPERSVALHAFDALAAGAEIHGHEPVLGWEFSRNRYVVTTDRGSYEAGSVVFTAGAWVRRVVGKIGVPVQAERTVLGWFQPMHNAELFAEDRLPVWIVDSPQCGHFYGFPIHGIPGFKLGRLTHGADPVDPELSLRQPDGRDEEDLRQFLRRHYPSAAGPVLTMATCMWENTPDRAFIVDQLPGFPGAWVLGGFSGHGFKYVPAMGEIVKDLVTQGKSRFDLAPFKLDRFANATRSRRTNDGSDR